MTIGGLLARGDDPVALTGAVDAAYAVPMTGAEALDAVVEMLDSSVTSAKKGVLVAQEVATRLTEIQSAAQKVNTLIGEIAAASQEQPAARHGLTA